MAELRNHGGNCCGARHISGFASEAAGIADLKRHHATDEQNLLYEVILSQNQCRQYPGLLRQLDRMGYVLTDRWIGAHGTPIARFSRARNRLPLRSLENGPVLGFEWGGMVAGPNLSGVIASRGDVDANAQAPNAGGRLDWERNARACTYGGRIWRVGERARINSTVNVANGETVVITRFEYPYDRNPVIRFIHRGFIRTCSVDRITLVGERNAAPADNAPAPAAPEVLRHGTLDDWNGAQAVRPVAPPAAAPAAPTVVFSTYHNIYADDRVGAGYDTAEAARAAAPRCQRMHRRDIYSDGTTQIVMGGQGANPFPRRP